MMKRKTLYLWGLLLLFLGIINSCRNDFLQEHQANQEIRNQGLTHKMIALSQSKHKDRLLRQLSKMKTELNKASFKNALARTVNYGDSISINTDHVIYIENGNYHTYTFNIERPNPQPNDPVENLLLSLLSDGTYREFLVTYQLTPQEKENIRNGIYYYSNQNTTITELADGTFNGNGQLARMVCGWTDETIWQDCSQHVHNQSNVDDWVNCTATTPPSVYTVSTYSCVEEVDETIAPTDPPGSGGGGGGGGGTPCEDCPPTEPTECTQVPNDPQEPNTFIDENGCAIGIPTLPNPVRNTPCQLIKIQRNDEEYKKRQDTLQGKSGLKKETGYIQKWGGSYEYKENASATDTHNSLTLPAVATNTYIKGFNHVHVDNYDFTDPSDGLVKTRIGIKVPSPADVAYFMDLVQNAQTHNHALDDVYGGMVSSGNIYQIRFTGNQYQIKTFTDDQKEAHREPYTKLMEPHVDNQHNLEKGFLWYISEKMNLKGVTLYRFNADGTTTEIKLNADKTDTVETTCPN